MTNQSYTAGDFVIYGSHGLHVVTGQKEQTIAGITEPYLELRPFQDLAEVKLSSIRSISKGSSAIRPPATAEQIKPVLEDLKTHSNVFSFTPNRMKEEADAALKLAEPAVIANILASIGKRYLQERHKKSQHQVNTPDLTLLSQTERDIANKALDILTDDLVMASGMKQSDARQHLIDMAMRRPKAKEEMSSWPESAFENNTQRINEALFQKLFGINFEQANDLEVNPIHIEDKERAKQLIRKHIYGDQSLTKAERKPMDNNTDPTDNRIPTRGVTQKIYEVAREALPPELLDIYVPLEIWKPEYRKDIYALAEEKDMDPQAVLDKRNEAVRLVIQAREEKGYSPLEKTFSALEIKTTFPDQDKQKKVTQSSDKEAPKNFFLANLYEIAKNELSEDLFAIYGPLELYNEEYRKDAQTLAEEKGCTKEEILAIRDQAVEEMHVIMEILDIEQPKRVYHCLYTREGIAKLEQEKKEKIRLARIAKKEQAKHNNDDASDKADPSTIPSYDEIIESMSLEGFNDKSLADLARCYQDKGKLLEALCFYGASLDLNPDDEKITEQLKALESDLGTTYNPAIHFKAAEQLIQAAMNGEDTPSFDVNYNPEQTSVDEDVIIEGEGDDDVIEAEFEDVSDTDELSIDQVFGESSKMNSDAQERYQNQSNNKANAKSPAVPVPAVTYALPAEIFQPGHALKMSFERYSDGRLDVTMQLVPAELATNNQKAEGAEISRGSNGEVFINPDAAME